MSKNMSRLAAAFKTLPKGLYPWPLRRFVNGKVSLTRRGTVKVPMEFEIAPLGSPYDDIRAVLDPEDNKLVPVLVFVDLDEFEGKVAETPTEDAAPNLEGDET